MSITARVLGVVVFAVALAVGAILGDAWWYGTHPPRDGVDP